jgi:hypothetical protein
MKTCAFCLTACLTIATLGLTGGCVVQPLEPAGYVSTDVYVASDPPPLIAETIPVSPGIGFVWVGGGWVWRDHWVWEAGRWQRPPHPGAVWYPHRFEYRNGHRVFIRGGWR